MNAPQTGRRGSDFDIASVEHQHGIFTAKFPTPLAANELRLPERFAFLGNASGKDQLVDRRPGFASSVRAVPVLRRRDDLEDELRHSRLMEQLRQLKCGQRVKFRGFSKRLRFPQPARRCFRSPGSRRDSSRGNLPDHAQKVHRSATRWLIARLPFVDWARPGRSGNALSIRKAGWHRERRELP